MNTKWSKLFSILLLTTILFLVVGCDDDDLTGPDVTGLFETWEQTAVTVDGTIVHLADFFDWSDETVGVHITLNSDLTYDVNEFDASDSTLYFEHGTMVTDNNSLILSATSENGNAVTPYQTFNGTWLVSGDILTLSTFFEGVTVLITMTKVV